MSVAPRHTHPEAISSLFQGLHGDPFSILGPHPDGDGTVLRVMRPHAESACAVSASTGKVLLEMSRVHPDGFFEGRVTGTLPAYRLKFRRDRDTWTEDDPFRFGSGFGELDLYLMAAGNDQLLYHKLGAHELTLEGVQGTRFAVWAPNAQRVSVVGHFNSWDGRRHPMRLHPGAGIWELFVPGVRAGEVYKYELRAQGQILLKADPLAFRAEIPPATASIVHGLPHHEWADQVWMERRAQTALHQAPMSTYEVHPASWKRHDDGSSLSYSELGKQLLSYVLDMGFTHIQFMPLSEHPFSGSWGYQPTGLFAPTSRFGTPEDFAALVDRCHQAGIGVLVDFVPAHFPTDAHGLGQFDGTALYEHADPRLGYHLDWNTLIYNFGRREVQNFLAAAARYWADQFHIDGLRVDAVASMLYLDYSRPHDQWVPNRHGGNHNLEAIEFIQRMNTEVYGAYPGVTTIAEESTAFNGVSRPVDSGGLGFGFKWNMGWMHDTLDYMSRDPIYRKFHHDEFTFSLVYAWTENFVLPLSHDEVVHGKGSLLTRMPGDRWQRFANLRAYFGYMWTHPGKKLLFMGGEFAQQAEWNHDAQLDWAALSDPMHAGVQSLIRDLNRIYCQEPALHRLDCSPAGFEWIDSANRESSIFVFLRCSDDGNRPVAIICNMTPAPHTNYRVGVPEGGVWEELVNSDAVNYGGSGMGNSGQVQAIEVSTHGRPMTLELTIPPLSTIVLAPVR